jgi:hypothetical protein
VNGWRVPFAIEGVAGATVMESKVAAVIVKVVAPEMAPTVAVIEDVP